MRLVAARHVRVGDARPRGPRPGLPDDRIGGGPRASLRRDEGGCVGRRLFLPSPAGGENPVPGGERDQENKWPNGEGSAGACDYAPGSVPIIAARSRNAPGKSS